MQSLKDYIPIRDTVIPHSNGYVEGSLCSESGRELAGNWGDTEAGGHPEYRCTGVVLHGHRRRDSTDRCCRYVFQHVAMSHCCSSSSSVQHSPRKTTVAGSPLHGMDTTPSPLHQLAPLVRTGCSAVLEPPPPLVARAVFCLQTVTSPLLIPSPWPLLQRADAGRCGQGSAVG